MALIEALNANKVPGMKLKPAASMMRVLNPT